jgi:hypothetical protein
VQLPPLIALDEPPLKWPPELHHMGPLPDGVTFHIKFRVNFKIRVAFTCDKCGRRRNFGDTFNVELHPSLPYHITGIKALLTLASGTFPGAAAIAIAYHVWEAKSLIESLLDISDQAKRALDLTVVLRKCVNTGLQKRSVSDGFISPINDTALQDLEASIKFPADFQKRISEYLGIPDLSQKPKEICSVDNVVARDPRQRYCLCHDYTGHSNGTTCGMLDRLPAQRRGNQSWANVPCVPVLCQPRNTSMPIRFIRVNSTSLSHSVASTVLRGISKELEGANASQIISIEPSNGTSGAVIALQVDPNRVDQLEKLKAVSAGGETFTIEVTAPSAEDEFRRSPWFIVVIVAACLVGTLVVGLVVVLFLRSRHEKREGSSDDYVKAE